MKPLRITAATVVVVGSGLLASTVASGATSIQLRDNAFSPRIATVKRGSTVTFRWTGRAAHNVTVTAGPVKFKSKTQSKGSYRRRLSRKGTYSYVCTIHTGMNGKLQVK